MIDNFSFTLDWLLQNIANLFYGLLICSIYTLPASKIYSTYYNHRVCRLWLCTVFPILCILLQFDSWF
jgi:hypothetical protein